MRYVLLSASLLWGNSQGARYQPVNLRLLRTAFLRDAAGSREVEATRPRRRIAAAEDILGKRNEMERLRTAVMVKVQKKDCSAWAWARANGWC